MGSPCLPQQKLNRVSSVQLRRSVRAFTSSLSTSLIAVANAQLPRSDYHKAEMSVKRSAGPIYGEMAGLSQINAIICHRQYFVLLKFGHCLGLG